MKTQMAPDCKIKRRVAALNFIHKDESQRKIDAFFVVRTVWDEVSLLWSRPIWEPQRLGGITQVTWPLSIT
jgi:hypothetical protein